MKSSFLEVKESTKKLLFQDLKGSNIDEIYQDFDINSINQTRESILFIFNEEQKKKNEKQFEYTAYKNLGNFSTYFCQYFLTQFDWYSNEYIEEIEDIEFFKKNLTDQLSNKILKISYRTLIYEMNVMRKENMFESTLKDEQYLEFCNKLKDSTFVKEILLKYPVMDYLVYTTITFFKEFIFEIVKHFKNDKSILVQNTLIIEEDKIKCMILGQGDSHNKGKTVVKIKMSTGKTLYYKPRNLEVDLLFNKVIQLLSEKENIDLCTYGVCSLKNHGWVEEVEYKPVKTLDELFMFYKNMGSLLAILYALNAVDIHIDNIIANGEIPMLIDCESLFHSSEYHEEEDNATRYLNNYLSQSVLSIGVLPFIFGTGSTDISALSDQKNKKTSIKVPTIKNSNRSNMKLVREYVTMKESKNNPNANDLKISEEEKEKNILEGFELGYHAVLSCRKQILHLIDRSNDKMILRHIIKPTLFYSNLIEISNHPSILIDFELLELLFARIQDEEHSKKINQEEFKDLLQRDVPYFFSCFKDKDLYKNGEVIEKNSFTESKYSIFIKKMNMLSIEDKERQMDLIKSRLSISRFNQDQYNLKSFKENNAIDLNTKKQFIIDRAIKIGNEVINSAVKYNNTYSWLSYQLIGEVGAPSFLSINEMDYNLYDGLAGQGIMLLALFLQTNDNKYKKMLNAIIDDILNNVQTLKDCPLGAFSGGYGIIYLLALYCKKVEKRDTYIDKLLFLIESSLDELKVVEEYDIISGFAGILLILTNLYCNNIKSTSVVKAMDICVKYLIDGVTIDKNKYIGWKQSEGGEILTGFSHGIAGITYSLQKYQELSMNSINQSEVINKIIKETREFQAKSKNNGKFIDLRKESYNNIPYGWCHGLPGIIYSDEQDYQTKQNLIDMKENAFGRNHCLCHGDLGNLIILSEFNKDQNWIVDYAYHICTTETLFSGIGISDLSSDEFMVGNSGICWGLIYLFNNNLPNVLKLEI